MALVKHGLNVTKLGYETFADRPLVVINRHNSGFYDVISEEGTNAVDKLAFAMEKLGEDFSVGQLADLVSELTNCADLGRRGIRIWERFGETTKRRLDEIGHWYAEDCARRKSQLNRRKFNLGRAEAELLTAFRIAVALR